MTILDEMRMAGWYPERRSDIAPARLALTSENVEVWPELEAFLVEYSGLDFRGHLDDAVMRIDAVEAVEVTDAAWGISYGRALGRRLAPVGVYFHMTVYLADDGDLVGGVGDEYGRLGGSLPEVLDGVLNHHPVMPVLDRELPR